MIENDIVYRSGPDLPAASWLSATALTRIGPRMPAADHAVSSRPWIAPTWYVPNRSRRYAGGTVAKPAP